MARQKDIDEADNRKGDNSEFSTIKWDRTCTDKLCCLVFIIFIASIVAITGYAFTEGDPRKIITPFDSQGHLCGGVLQGSGLVKVDFTDYKYKLFTGLPQYMEDRAQGSNNMDTLYQAVCVKECPAKDVAAECKTNTDVNSCPTNELYGTQPFEYYCIPTKESAKDAYKMMMNALQKDPNFGTLTKYMQEISMVWKEMLYMCLASVVISIVYIFLLKWITKPLLYCSMVIILAMFILLGGWSFMKRDEFFIEGAEEQSDDYRNATIGAGVAWGIGFIYFCFMCCCWKNISLGATIMEAASEFVSSNLGIIALPLMSYVVAMIFFCYWLATAVFLYSVGTVQFEAKQLTPKMVPTKEGGYILWYFLFGLFWIFSFLICQQQMIIACMVVQWYFGGQGQENSDAPGQVGLFKSIGWGLWYHCGTVAFGSFCIAVITMIRVVFEYIVKQSEGAGAKENPIFKVVVCCVRGVLYLLDQYVKFISKNAFIQTALMNTSFCASAWNSFYLIVRHAGRFTSAGAIGWIMMLLGKGTIMSSTAYLTILYIKSSQPDISQPFVPAFLVAMAAYVVASLFLSIFSFSCTAILHCFILAEDSPGCSIDNPAGLQNFIDTQDSDASQKKSKDEKKKTEKEGQAANDMD